MNIKNALKLECGQKVMHTRYGECSVNEVLMSAGGELFGVVIIPATEIGRELLRSDSGTDIPTLLEDSVRMISVENNIPGSKPIGLGTAWGDPEGE